MKELSELNISNDTIEYLNKNLVQEEKQEIDMCLDRIETSISFLRRIGVSQNIIEEIFKIDYQIFNLGEERLKKAIKKVGEKKFVNAINQDIKYYIYLEDFM